MKSFYCLSLVLLLSVLAQAQAPTGYNYDESKVPKIQFSEPLKANDGQRSLTPAEWVTRRKSLLEQFAKTVYGPIPEPSLVAISNIEVEETEVWDGLAIRSIWELTFTYQDRELVVDLLCYRPTGPGPFRTFLGMNFYGNQSVIDDPAIPVCRNWVMKNPSLGIPENVATEASRGKRAERWPIRTIVTRGYAVCTLYYGDIDPDYDDGFLNGVHGLLGRKDFASVAAWAWGLRVVGEHLRSQGWVKDTAVFGHSRLGKAALWAGANDSNFDLVVSNNSGCGGAALSKRGIGETLEAINTRFPHWFVSAFHTFNGRELDLPIDQHLLMACIAPRNLYVTSASQDLWADPKGEQLALELARPVFQEFGGQVGYHMRPGKHNMLEFDWLRILDFADANWR